MFAEAPVQLVNPLLYIDFDEIPGKAVSECELIRLDVPVKLFYANKALSPDDIYKMMDESSVHKLEIIHDERQNEGKYSVIAK